VVAWLAQRMDKTSIGRLLRCSYEAVDAIVARVVVDRPSVSRLSSSGAATGCTCCPIRLSSPRLGQRGVPSRPGRRL
jgi:hypothetical protein